MAEIALAFAKTGNAQEADNLMRRVLSMDKNNVNFIYEQAQINALLGRQAEALKALKEAFEKHFPAEYAAGDEDLTTLRTTPEFVGLVKKYSAKKP